MIVHEEHMKTAINLAQKGCGFVNPNPLVGAVIEKNGKIIGQGYHLEYGKPHAEKNALADCRQTLNNAIMYVTLEPCCHYGKTPPCTEAIISSGIKKVVIGCLDPNPQVSGKGVQELTKAGIEVIVGVLERECQKQNEVFFHYIQTKTPFVVLKYAMTADGKIAASSGVSKWITGKVAREKVHYDRSRYMGIMVGIGTVLADDPLLTCRLPNGKNPVRIVCDTHLQTPVISRIALTARDVKTIIATACYDKKKQRPLIESGCEILHVPINDKHINLKALMQELGSMGIDSIMLEGGSLVNFSALKDNIVNKIQTYIAPKVLGGTNAKTPVGGIGFFDMDNCIRLKNQIVSYLGEDILIESEVAYNCSQES